MATQADTAVVVGTVSDYLTAKGDAKLYNINLPAGVYLQAQLTTLLMQIWITICIYGCRRQYFNGLRLFYTYINGTARYIAEALRLYNIR